MSKTPKTKKCLFICTANLQRSPTAERLFADCHGIETRSAGTYANYGKQVNQEFIDWADFIFVMSEERDGHLSYLKNNFSLGEKKVYDLAIPDVYEENDNELKKVLIEKVAKYLDLNSYLDHLRSSIGKQ